MLCLNTQSAQENVFLSRFLIVSCNVNELFYHYAMNLKSLT